MEIYRKTANNLYEHLEYMPILFIHSKNVLRSEVLFNKLCLQSSPAALQKRPKEQIGRFTDHIIIIHYNDDNDFDIK